MTVALEGGIVRPPIFGEEIMQIEFTRDNKKAELPDKVANELIRRGVARKPQTRELKAEISPRTGKPKRQYKRRDMQAED